MGEERDVEVIEVGQMVRILFWVEGRHLNKRPDVPHWQVLLSLMNPQIAPFEG